MSAVLHAVTEDQGTLFELPPVSLKSGAFTITSVKNLPLNADQLAEVVAAVRANPELQIPVTFTGAGIINKFSVERGHIVVSVTADAAELML